MLLCASRLDAYMYVFQRQKVLTVVDKHQPFIYSQTKRASGVVVIRIHLLIPHLVSYLAKLLVAEEHGTKDATDIEVLFFS